MVARSLESSATLGSHPSALFADATYQPPPSASQAAAPGGRHFITRTVLMFGACLEARQRGAPAAESKRLAS